MKAIDFDAEGRFSMRTELGKANSVESRLKRLLSEIKTTVSLLLLLR